MRILLAEDDHHISVILKIALEKVGGHQVHVVSDGVEALQLVQQQKFDLLILDGMMPKKSGLQVAQDLKASGQTEIPIIFLSAKSEKKDLQAFAQFGNGYIAKPFDPMTISQEIDRILFNKKEMAP